MFSYLESGAFRFSARRAHAMSFCVLPLPVIVFFCLHRWMSMFSGRLSIRSGKVSIGSGGMDCRGGVTRYNCYKLQLAKSVTGNLEKEINTIYIIYI